VQLDKDYTAAQSREPWEEVYARGLQATFDGSAAR